MNSPSSSVSTDLIEQVEKIQIELDTISYEMYSDAHFLIEGIREGCAAALKGNYGVGAVIVHEDRIVARGQNRVMENGYVHAPVAHGEAEAVFDLRKGAHSDLPRRELVLYAPLEPCMICTGTIMNEGIGTVKIGALDEPGGMIISHFNTMPPVFREIIRDSGMKIEQASVDKRIQQLSWDIFFATKNAIDTALKLKGQV